MVDAAAQNAYSLLKLQNKYHIDKNRGILIIILLSMFIPAF